MKSDDVKVLCTLALISWSLFSTDEIFADLDKHEKLALEKVHNELKKDLKDPSSIQFRKEYIISSAIGKEPYEMTICGEFNAKNSYGGYAGFQKYRGNITRLLSTPMVTFESDAQSTSAELMQLNARLYDFFCISPLSTESNIHKITQVGN